MTPCMHDIIALGAVRVANYSSILLFKSRNSMEASTTTDYLPSKRLSQSLIRTRDTAKTARYLHLHYAIVKVSQWSIRGKGR